MSEPVRESPFRVLIVDDNPAIHEDFRKILGNKSDAQSRLEDVEAALFGETVAPLERTCFRINSAYQGQEAVALVRKAAQENDPYALAFVDVRMPPGWDGVETLEHVWKEVPDLQAVICTAYSDYSWDDMMRRLGYTENLLILKKPFETVEVLQLAHALTQKWSLGRQAKLRMEDLDQMVRQRTEELVAANRKLQQEIDQRVRIQEALRISEERFSKAFHSSPGPVAILSSTHRGFLDANQSFTSLCGYSIEQLTQRSENARQLWLSNASPDAETFFPEGRLRNRSCALRCSDNSIRQVLLSAEPISIGATQCLLLNVEDVTEQIKLESQLRQAQKMEVVGRMAAGIAHEFNNVLTVIQGNVGLLQSVNSNMIDKRALLNQIMQASQRAASFTKQLLAFSRKQVLQPHPLNLSLLVQNMRKMLGRLIGEKYEVKLTCRDKLPSVIADEGSIEQVLINLALNARDAMPDGGSIEITTETAVFSETAISSNSEARAGRFVCLTLRDHGCGMSPHVLARIFDPFFTTKDVGKGTGLGLATIHGIIEQHEGWIDVSSEVGRGSVFKIYLPAHDDVPTVAATPRVDGEVIAADAGRGVNVLVVEDEAAVRDLAIAALQKRGYQVINAANGPEAIEIWESSSAKIDLLLTDIVMPFGMSGCELAKILSSRNSELKVIFTSGYSPEILRRDSLLTQDINFIPKPYDLHTLLESVRICLEGGKLPSYEVRPLATEPALAIK